MAKVAGTVLCLSLIMWCPLASAEETGLLPDPTTAEMADTVKVKWGTLGMTNCTNKEVASGNANIVCYFALTQTRYDQSEFPVEKVLKWERLTSLQRASTRKKREFDKSSCCSGKSVVDVHWPTPKGGSYVFACHLPDWVGHLHSRPSVRSSLASCA